MKLGNWEEGYNRENGFKNDNLISACYLTLKV